jgi:large subunit ribosomal protein L23
MALFGKKKDTKRESKAAVEKVDVSKAQPTDFNQSAIVVAPRLTEKTVSLGDNNVYTFEVKKDATKYQVKQAVKALYDVTPVKVNIVNKRPAKRMVGSRGKEKHVAGMKKAYVYLKKGDTINLV